MRFGLFLASLTLSVPLLCSAAGEDTKALLCSNGSVCFTEPPADVQSLSRIFAQGEFVGRLRTNSFFYDYRDDSYAGRKDNRAVAVGGSLIFRSALYRGFGAKAALYTSQNPYHMDDADVVYLKSGKDVTDRYRVLKNGDWGMSVLAEAFLRYMKGGTQLRAGRLAFDSLLTAANDSKMIPNTFEGYTLETPVFGDGWLKAAWLVRQKLRGHTSFHHLLAYGDDPADPYSKYSQNDDSAMHRGLTLSKLNALGIKDRLLVAEYRGGVGKRAGVMLNYSTVPDLLSYAAADIYLSFRAAGVKISPALRYLRQMDEGAGAIGGANLKGDTAGYADPDSLDGALYAARVDFARGDVWRLRVGVSYVEDRGDIVAPWRGFPTGGFTRAMGQYNWYADTQSYMVRADYDFGEAGIAGGLKGTVKYVIEDFDDAKPGVPADIDVVNIDITERFEAVQGLYARLRMAIGFGSSQAQPVQKPDPSYSEYRFEVNYLF
ncbi:hypothetical protein NNO_0279 [Hydrogenimonas sp.]|nr:hypothetical protein NNO_0279 [Hydrogenimonas sp.]